VRGSFRSILIVFGFIGIVLVVSTILTNVSAKKEIAMTVNFKVEKVEITPALRISLYDVHGRKFDLKSWTLFDRDRIFPGDSLAKPKNSNLLEVWRKENNQDWRIIKTIKQD
jgi:hypothetical protein